MESNKRHYKGGAEKNREQKKKKLLIQAAHCQKVTNFFTKPKLVLVPSTSADSGDVIAQGESDETDIETEELTVSISQKDFIEEINQSQGQAISSSNIIANTADADSDSNTFNFQHQHGNINQNIYFNRPMNESGLQDFLLHHPFQPDNKNCELPFQASNIFYRKENGSNRKWLSYSTENKKLYCFICLAFSAANEDSSFVSGMSDWRHIHQRIKEHEISHIHRRCSEAFLMSENKKDISSILLNDAVNLRNRQIKENRDIFERIVEVIRVIGKRGLAYRSDNEAARLLDDEKLDHGNFLELLRLISKFDPQLKLYLSKVVDDAKKRHKIGSRSRGRGSAITMISKTTINYIIEVIRKLLKNKISEEVKEAGMFSVQLDTSQDVTVKDQCCVVIRYVKDAVHERLLSVVQCTSSTGEAMCNLLVNSLKECNIDIKNCVENSTDGASNMQGQYNGFTARLTDLAPDQVHVWCYAHVLNLVIVDTTSCALPAANLFENLNTCAVFLRESYKRMDAWTENTQNTRQKRLNTIGETRWSSKYDALKKIFGEYDDLNKNSFKGLYVELILTLEHLSISQQYNATIRKKANDILQKFLAFETILTALIFLRIFKFTGPLSKYLQTKGLDVLQAYKMAMHVLEDIKKLSRDFANIRIAAHAFVLIVNEELERQNSEMIVEDSLPEKRIRKPKLMSGEYNTHTSIKSPIEKYTVEVHNIIFDTAVQTLQRRFQPHGLLYADISCMHPNNFNELIESGIPPNAFDKLSNLLKKFVPDITPEILKTEMVDFASKWKTLSKTLCEEYSILAEEENKKMQMEMHSDSDEDIEDEDMNDVCSNNMKCGKNRTEMCRKCLYCCYSLLLNYNLYCSAYSNLFAAYKLILTLSSTQVSCETGFSKLKIIKNRLRSSMTQEKLEAFMLMSVEKDLLNQLKNSDILEGVSAIAPVLRKNLIYI